MRTRPTVSGILAAGLGLAACGPSTPDPAGPSGSLTTGLGRLSLTLTGAGGSAANAGAPLGKGNGNAGGKSHALENAMVVVDRVTAHAPGIGWVTLRDSTQITVDVLRLGDHATELGFAELPAGKITQIRLHVDGRTPPYVTTPDGETVALKVPSGEQSGLKVKGVFGVEACADTSVTLDLDGKKSIWIHPTGRGDLYVLRPVIRAGSSARGIDGCTPPPATEPEPSGTTDPTAPPSTEPPPASDTPPSIEPPPSTEPPPTGVDPDPTNGGASPPDGGETTIPGDGEGETTPPTDGETAPGEGGEPTTPPTDGTPCSSNDECGISAFCGDDGFCLEV